MLDKSFCTNEIAKLSGLDFWPKEREGKAELVSALQHFDTNQKAQKWIADWLTYQTQCPKPAQIREAAYREQGQNARGCLRCGGTEFVVSWWLITQETSSGSIWKSKDRLQGDLALNSIVGDMKRSEFCKELGPGQYVIEAAEMCECHPGRKQAS